MTEIEKVQLKILDLEEKIKILYETIENLSFTKDYLEQYVQFEKSKSITEIPTYGNRSNTEEIS